MKKIYNENNCRMIGDVKYERLVDHPEGHKYRIIFSDDDYDYVTDADDIAELDYQFA